MSPKFSKFWDCSKVVQNLNKVAKLKLQNHESEWNRTYLISFNTVECCKRLKDFDKFCIILSRLNCLNYKNISSILMVGRKKGLSAHSHPCKMNKIYGNFHWYLQRNFAVKFERFFYSTFHSCLNLILFHLVNEQNSFTTDEVRSYLFHRVKQFYPSLVFVTHVGAILIIRGYIICCCKY